MKIHILGYTKHKNAENSFPCGRFAFCFLDSVAEKVSF